jgi:hypothetical protein
MTHIPTDLILACYPNSRGFGYVLFEGALSPFDWAIKEIRGRAKNQQILKLLGRLLDRYRPLVLVLEDWTDEAFQRIGRINDLYKSIVLLARTKLIPVIRIPMRKVREYFAYRNALTKYEIALHIARIIPAFSYKVPPKPTIWRHEDARQLLYDAAMIGVAYFANLTTIRGDDTFENNSLS